MNLQDFVQTAKLTFQKPKQGLQVVLGWRFSQSEAMAALALMSIISALMVSAVMGPLPADVDPLTASILQSPLRIAIAQFVGLWLTAVAFYILGLSTKGQGTLVECLTLVAWLEVILTVLTLAQTIILLLLPSLAFVVVIGGMAYSLWLMTNFVAQVHGYQSLGLTLLGILVAMFGVLLLAVSVLLVFLTIGVRHV